MKQKRVKTKRLTPNMEDYLEVIATLSKESNVTRVKDIAHLMKVKTPSVTSALSFLSEAGLVVHERYGYVKLTPEGKKTAQGVQNRHNILIKFLTDILKINHSVASEDACKMEHSVSPQTLEKLTKFIEFVETCPDGERPDWLKSFDRYFETGIRPRCKIRDIKQKSKTG